MTPPPASASLPPRAILSAEERAMLVAYVEEYIETDRWPVDLAAKSTGLPAELLRHLVAAGALPGDTPKYKRLLNYTCDIHQARALAARLAEVRQSVEGVGIGSGEAEAKYGFSDQSIFNWCKNGWVQVVGLDTSGHRLYNEGDIAVARVLADLVGHVAGRAVFPSKPRTGRPRRKKA